MARKRHIAECLKAFNQGREPERLAMKYKAMNKDALAFLRGSCHLFYEDWPKDSPLDATPAAWICGDLHLENFGSYKGDNRLVYFDINDFDESALAPATWDLARFLTSVWVAADTHWNSTPRKLRPYAEFSWMPTRRNCLQGRQGGLNGTPPKAWSETC